MLTTSLLVLALVVPVLACLVAWGQEQKQAVSVQETADTFVSLAETPRTVSLNATITPQWAVEHSVRAPAMTGVITEVFAKSGEALKSDDDLLRVDGVVRRFFLLKSPLYSDVCYGDKVQVEPLRQVLKQAGLSVGISATVDRVDRESIREFAHSIGVPNSAGIQCLAAAWIVSSPHEVRKIKDLNITAGSGAPQQGEILLTAGPEIESIELKGTSGVEAVDGYLSVEDNVVFADAELVIFGKRSGIVLRDANTKPTREFLSEVLDKEEASTQIVVRAELTENQYLISPNAMSSSFDGNACVQVEGEPSSQGVLLIGSAVNGVVIETETNLLGSRIVASSEALSCD